MLVCIDYFDVDIEEIVSVLFICVVCDFDFVNVGW